MKVRSHFLGRTKVLGNRWCADALFNVELVSLLHNCCYCCHPTMISASYGWDVKLIYWGRKVQTVWLETGCMPVREVRVKMVMLSASRRREGSSSELGCSQRHARNNAQQQAGRETERQREDWSTGKRTDLPTARQSTVGYCLKRDSQISTKRLKE